MDEHDAAQQPEVWSTTTNSPVVRMPGRRYPGVVIQGDSLSALFESAMQLVERAAESNDAEGLEVGVDLAEQLHAHLEHYEAVLAARGVGLPYVRRRKRTPRQFLDATGSVGDPRAPERPASPDVGWAVWRQDDNGNRFLINGGLTREEAERLCSEFEARGHKQLYWVTPDDRSAAEVTPGELARR